MKVYSLGEILISRECEHCSKSCGCEYKFNCPHRGRNKKATKLTLQGNKFLCDECFTRFGGGMMFDLTEKYLCYASEVEEAAKGLKLEHKKGVIQRAVEAITT